MYRQMMKRKQPSSTPLLDGREAALMADEVARQLERGIKLGPERKRPKTIPMHDPFFVGTPEEEAAHLQRMESRMKRKSEDFSSFNSEIQHAADTTKNAFLLNRGSKIPRRAKAQLSVADMDALNQKLSTVDLNDASSANPCRALTLYTPPLRSSSAPIITTADDPADEQPDPETSLLYRYRHRFSFKIEDMSKALIIYSQEHPLQSVIDRIREYERRTGRSGVKIEEISSTSPSSSSSGGWDDIDEDDVHSASMFEDQEPAASSSSSPTASSSRYVVDEEEDGEAELDGIIDEEGELQRLDEDEEEAAAVEPIVINDDDRFEELIESAFLPTSTATTTTTSSPSSFYMAPSSSSFPASLPASQAAFPFSGVSPPPASFGSFSSSSSSTSSSSSSTSSSASAFFSAPPVFGNTAFPTPVAPSPWPSPHSM